MLYKAERTPMVIDQGKFVVRVAMPGLNIPGHPDHGHGPLALIAESFMAPDTWITMHEHVQDEIISSVPASDRVRRLSSGSLAALSQRLGNSIFVQSISSPR